MRRCPWSLFVVATLTMHSSREVFWLCRDPDFLVPRAASPQTSEEAVDSPSAADESGDAYTPAYAIHVSAPLPVPQFLLPMWQYDESEEFEDVDSGFLPPFRYDHSVFPHHMSTSCFVCAHIRRSSHTHTAAASVEHVSDRDRLLQGAYPPKPLHVAYNWQFLVV